MDSKIQVHTQYFVSTLSGSLVQPHPKSFIFLSEKLLQDNSDLYVPPAQGTHRHGLGVRHGGFGVQELHTNLSTLKFQQPTPIQSHPFIKAFPCSSTLQNLQMPSNPDIILVELQSLAAYAEALGQEVLGEEVKEVYIVDSSERTRHVSSNCLEILKQVQKALSEWA